MHEYEEAGYAGKILRVDLSSGSSTLIPTREYATRFLGGRGIAAKIYWDEVSPQTGPFDAQNRLLFLTGPLAGFHGLAGSRWQVCGKSPATHPEGFCYSNLGGSWGAQLKLAGYDGLVIEGKSDKPVYLYIQDDTVQIREATSLWGKRAVEVRQDLKIELGNSVRVVTTGTAGDHLVPFATLLADNDATGSCGLAAVMGSKNLKAIAVRGSGSVKAAHPDRLRDLTSHIRRLKEEPFITLIPMAEPNLKREACYGCIQGCQRAAFEASDGTRSKFMCQSALFYLERALRHYGEWNEVPFRAGYLCNDYGLDTNVLETMITWLSRCRRSGILNDDNTGIPLSRMGSLEFIETLVRKIALREGFGEVLAQGIWEAAQVVGQDSGDLITADYTIKAGQNAWYQPRMFIVTGLLYAMEPRQPIQQLHEVGILSMKWLWWAAQQEGGYLSSQMLRAIARRFWGSEVAADFSTYEGKALAAKKIQDREYAKESLILCDLSWPITDVVKSEDHLGDATLESQVLSAVTGKEVDEEELYRFGERVFNLQRAILVREGHRARQDDSLSDYHYNVPLKRALFNPECLAPGKDGEVISRKGAMVDREKFEQMKTEYYQLRGWDTSTGLQPKGKLEELGLADVASEMERLGLLA